MHSIENYNKKYFQCDNGLLIDAELVNGLVPDCGLTADDEWIYKSLLENNTNMMCPSKDQIPCKEEHPMCYSFSDICIYQLNKCHDVIPCRIGSHMQDCDKF